MNVYFSLPSNSNGTIKIYYRMDKRDLQISVTCSFNRNSYLAKRHTKSHPTEALLLWLWIWINLLFLPRLLIFSCSTGQSLELIIVCNATPSSFYHSKLDSVFNIAQANYEEILNQHILEKTIRFTWFAERNSWLLSFIPIYMFSPSNWNDRGKK